MTDRELMQMALDAIESKYIVNCGAWRVQQDQAAKALRERLSQPEPDAVLAEREACAKLIESLDTGWPECEGDFIGAAAKIRNRNHQ